MFRFFKIVSQNLFRSIWIRLKTTSLNHHSNDLSNLCTTGKNKHLLFITRSKPDLQNLALLSHKNIYSSECQNHLCAKSSHLRTNIVFSTKVTLFSIMPEMYPLMKKKWKSRLLIFIQQNIIGQPTEWFFLHRCNVLWKMSPYPSNVCNINFK